MNIKALFCAAASEHTGEFTEKNKDKLGILISQQMLRFENHKASTTANENLLSLTATEPLQLKSQMSHLTLLLAKMMMNRLSGFLCGQRSYDPSANEVSVLGLGYRGEQA